MSLNKPGSNSSVAQKPKVFFTPIPCAYTSSPQDGMAKNFFYYMDTQDYAIYHIWIHFIPTSLYPGREKALWSELESNPDPLASQVSALTTRPWLLGRQETKVIFTRVPRISVLKVVIDSLLETKASLMLKD